jgi:molecular chaperone GrpE
MTDTRPETEGPITDPEHELEPGSEPAAAAPDGAAAADGQAPAEGEVPAEPEAEPEPEPESELETALRERGEYLELAQRTRADLENFRRRMAGEAAGAELRGRASLAKALLPALDNLERALMAAGVNPDGEIDESEPASREVSAQTALAEGIALVYRDLRAGLRHSGVEAFDPRGERFDPARHEAVATGESDGAAKGEVLETLEKGYAIGDQVLRPARVVVNG